MRNIVTPAQPQPPPPVAIDIAIEGIRSADFLSEEQKRDIFYNNAVRFLRWNASKQ
jgi:predicted TIM-barrel fold metal-dependent hydrolase